MIKIEMDGDIAVIRMDHGKVNAMDLEFCYAMNESLDKVLASDCKAAVLTGNDRVFSAGVDLVRIVNEDEDYLSKFLPALVRCLKGIFQFEKPLVAAINGHAIAGGCLLASACDRRLIHGKARIGLPELRVGVPLPSVAIEIIRFVAQPCAFQTMVTVGQTYRGQNAIDVGLADVVVDQGALLESAKKAARDLTAIPESVFAVSKSQMRANACRQTLQNEASFDEDVFELWKSDEIREIIEQYVQSRL